MRQKLCPVSFGSILVLFLAILLVSPFYRSASASEPHDLKKLEAETILSDTIVERILSTQFAPEKDIGINGAVGPNQNTGYFNIRPQADGSYLAMALGIARSNPEMIELAIRALEFGLAQQHPDGSFAGSSEQDTARFGFFGLRACNLLSQSKYAKRVRGRLDRIYERLLRTEYYIFDAMHRHPEIYETTNQVAMLAYVLITIGQKSGNSQFVAEGESLLRRVLEAQREDGVFPEMGGHDSHYQAVSLMILANIYLHTANPEHQKAIYPSMVAGFRWTQTRISSSGHIDDEGNTRTANNPSDSPENKQINPSEIALTLLYLSYLGPEFEGARYLSELVLEGMETQ